MQSIRPGYDRAKNGRIKEEDTRAKAYGSGWNGEQQGGTVEETGDGRLAWPGLAMCITTMAMARVRVCVQVHNTSPCTKHYSLTVDTTDTRIMGHHGSGGGGHRRNSSTEQWMSACNVGWRWIGQASAACTESNGLEVEWWRQVYVGWWCGHRFYVYSTIFLSATAV